MLIIFLNPSSSLSKLIKIQHRSKDKKTKIFSIKPNFGLKEIINLPLINNQAQEKRGENGGKIAYEPGNDRYFILKIELKDEGTKFLLLSLSLDIMAIHKNFAYVLARAEELKLIRASGLDYSIIKQAQPRMPKKEQLSSSSANGAYHSYKEVEEGLKAITEEFSPVAALHNLGHSLEGRNIWGIKISDNAELEEDEAKILFVGCHHAREWISVEVPYMLAEHLVSNYRGDPRIRRLVDQSEIWIVPLLNPDGLEYSIQQFRWWRKNRRNNGDGTFGVDPNRNYGYMWGIDDIGSSPITYSQVFRGPYAFSEPETEAMMRLFQQREFLAAISYHNYSQLILYPWSYTWEKAPDFSLFRYLSDWMAQLIKTSRGKYYAPGHVEQLYLCNGEFTDWAYGEYGTIAFTVELPPDELLLGGFVNSEQEIIPIFQENLPAALFLIQWSIDNF